MLLPNAEAQARNHRLGIWSQASPLVADAAQADLSPGAFLNVHDTITGVVRNGAGLKLLVVGRLNVGAADPDLARFTANPAELMGRQVLVRGRLREYRGTPELDVHAPAAPLAQD